MSSSNSKLQLVPETILKKRHDLDDMNFQRNLREMTYPRVNRKVFSDKIKSINVLKIETVLAAARMRKNHTLRYNRIKKKSIKKILPNISQEIFCVSSENTNSAGAKMVFCVRIRNHRGVPRDVKNVLNQFRLRQEYHGVFLRHDCTTRKLLLLVEPWVTYGTISQATVSDLLQRRGHFKLEKKRIPISNNTLVEKALLKKTNGSVICIQDIVHELIFVGDNFHNINASLWPFCLTPPKSLYEKKILNLQDGGDYGDRGIKLDEYIKKIL
jgi:60S ribosomal protein uL30